MPSCFQQVKQKHVIPLQSTLQEVVAVLEGVGAEPRAAPEPPMEYCVVSTHCGLSNQELWVSDWLSVPRHAEA